MWFSGLTCIFRCPFFFACSPKCILHENRLFRLGAVVSIFAETTLAAEKLLDVGEAAKLELVYTVCQGINRNWFVEADLHMTLKLVFLFVHSKLQLSDDEKLPFWQGMVEYALPNKAGLLLTDLFQGHRLVSAVEWMGELYRGVENVRDIVLSRTLYLPPHFINGVESEGNFVGGVDLQVSLQGDDDAVVGVGEYARCMELVKLLETCVGVQEVVWMIEDFLRGKTVSPRRPRSPDIEFEFDQELVRDVWDACHLIGSRTAGLSYTKDLKINLRTPPQPLKDGSTATPQSPAKVSRVVVVLFYGWLYFFLSFPRPISFAIRRTLPPPLFNHVFLHVLCLRTQVFSVEEYVREVAEAISREKGWLSPEIDGLQKYGFFTKKVFSCWYMGVLEQVSLRAGRDFNPLFLKGVEGQELPSWDVKRLISEVKKEDLLWRLICEPIKKMLADLGLVRDVGVCALLLSLKRLVDVLQGFHADTDPTFEWKDGFALSVIVAGPEGAYIDLYPGSFDGGVGPKGRPVRVALDPGECLVFVGTIRHRGGSYHEQNLRYFVSFVVAEVMQRAKSAEKEAETNQLEMEDEFPEEAGMPFEKWKELPVVA